MKSIKLFSLICFLTFFYFAKTNAQEKKELLISYDSIIGKENLPITNGLFHYNNFRINDNKDIYFFSEKYTKGSLNYLGQNYLDIYLKYDAYNDELVFRPSGKSEKTGVNLIKSNINSFKINGSTFVNLDKLNPENNDVINGFYEEKIKNSTLSFYVKHYKSKREVFVNKNVLIEFSDEKYYIVYRNNKYKEISSKNSVSSMFPEKKKIINEYFKKNSELRKKDKTLFFINLFENISK